MNECKSSLPRPARDSLTRAHGVHGQPRHKRIAPPLAWKSKGAAFFNFTKNSRRGHWAGQRSLQFDDPILNPFRGDNHFRRVRIYRARVSATPIADHLVSELLCVGLRFESTGGPPRIVTGPAIRLIANVPSVGFNQTFSRNACWSATRATPQPIR